MNPVALLSMVLTSAGYVPVNLHPLIIHESFEDNLGGSETAIDAIDEDDGRLMYCHYLYKVPFTTSSNLFVEDLWFQWAPGCQMPNAYDHSAHLGTCNITIEINRFVDLPNNKVGGAIQLLGGFPAASGANQSFSSAYGTTYLGRFANPYPYPVPTTVGFGSSIITPASNGSSFILSYGDGGAKVYFYDEYELDNNITEVTHSQNFTSTSHSQIVCSWHFEPEYSTSGADVFEFHCGIVFEVSKSTITVSENALSIAYNFSTSASYLTTTFFGHFPRIDYGDTRTYQGSWEQE